jgi:hypothetical protein
MSAEARTSAERHPWEAIMGQLEGYYREAYHLNQRINRMYPPRWSFIRAAKRDE